MAGRTGEPPEGVSTPVRPAQHCWVTGMPGQLDDAWPAILLGWGRDGDGRWWGRVAYTVPQGLGPAVIDTWVQAGYLRRLEPEPRRPSPSRRRFPN
ncbi:MULTISPECIES: hypothetical protein [Klenkia]|uniref:Uncharacterized protein n=2 Tax=Klenkia TaxID=2183612 RepID=A0A1I1QU69_9ACTN|nr:MULTISPECIES: hypothetical protein [Klenkia]GHE07467.1 hypothetical protein GCM10011381_04040 [Klenkia taihuensis]SDG22396.1 hypothetical protein SAMN05660324_2025 [Klenkia brasiliensis]SFD25537.1 hypothetical protein SAMN05661030_2964 [Klenkia taihuensis]